MRKNCCDQVKPENAARTFGHPAPVLLNSRVVQLLKERSPALILEIGGGCLRNALYLIRMGHQVTVLEVPNMKNRFPAQYQTFEDAGGRVLKSLSKAPRFEIVISTFVVETICNRKERMALLRDVHEHLRTGGSLILSARGPRDLLTAQNQGVPCGDGYITPNHSFARSFTRPQMKGFRLGQFQLVVCSRRIY
jgi:Tellurite resistance protein TehB